MAWLERPGARIFYTDTGGDKPCVVFSHGIFMNHRMFEPQVVALQEEFRCISWDERGHGLTESEGSFDYWELAEDLVALLDACDVPQAILVGMSQGGFISLRVALKAPERVAGLFLIDTQAGPEPENVAPIYEAMTERWEAEGPSRDLAETMAGIIVDPADGEPWISDWLGRSRDYLREPFACLVGREDLTERIPEIESPALVVHGSADPAIPTEKARALCDGLRRCEGLEVIEGGGHAANLSHPEETNRLLLEFCRRHAP